MSLQRNLILLAVFGASSLGALAQTAYAGELRGEAARNASMSASSNASRDDVRAGAVAATAADQIVRGDASVMLPAATSMKTRAEVSAEVRRAIGHVQRGDA